MIQGHHMVFDGGPSVYKIRRNQGRDEVDEAGLRRDKGVFGDTAVMCDLRIQHVALVVVKQQILFAYRKR